MTKQVSIQSVIGFRMYPWERNRFRCEPMNLPGTPPCGHGDTADEAMFDLLSKLVWTGVITPGEGYWPIVLEKLAAAWSGDHGEVATELQSRIKLENRVRELESRVTELTRHNAELLEQSQQYDARRREAMATAEKRRAENWKLQKGQGLLCGVPLYIDSSLPEGVVGVCSAGKIYHITLATGHVEESQNLLEITPEVLVPGRKKDEKA